MKRFAFILTMGILAVVSVQAQTPVYDSVFLNSGYVKDVYYSLQNGMLNSADGSQWDLAISVQPVNPPFQTVQSTSIRMNGGRGVAVYKVTTNDTSGFSAITTVDTTTWQRLYDSDTSWDYGALNSTINTANPYDYGWGEYNLTTHNVVADSFYALKTTSGAFKKMWIRELAFDTLWRITISDFNNANPVNIDIHKHQYPNRNFVFLDADAGAILDLEPAQRWDLLFTHYQTFIGIYYPVTGVLMNKGDKVAKATGVNINTVSYDSYESALTGNISEIGYDWKVYTGTYSLVDSLVYFIKTNAGDVYRLRFTGFDEPTGKVVFEKELIQTAAGVDKVNIDTYLTIYPNPSSNILHVNTVSGTGTIQLQLIDMMGRTVKNVSLLSYNNLVNENIDISEMPRGIYMVKLMDGTQQVSRKVVLN